MIKDEKILPGKRKNAHGEGERCYPGGHLEYDELWEKCFRREVTEEIDITIFLGNLIYQVVCLDWSLNPIRQPSS
ncbi:NUDIX domain-containing protein [Patescibacteria group bacterium]|nr:NUDIX domain-containing protein [Patescibacteria group bacterium]